MRVGLMRLKYDQGGGAERSLGLLARGLLERGHQVHALVSAWEGLRPAGLDLRLVPTRGRGVARLKSFAAGAMDAASALSLDTCLSLERVPGAPVFRTGDGCHAAWLKRRSPYESFLKRLSFRFNPLHRGHLELERGVLTSPGLVRVIANSRLVAEELKAYYGLDEEKLKVVYNGVDEQRLNPARSKEARQAARRELGLAPGEPALLFLGSGFERKGLAFACAALPKLPKAKLLVAGRGRGAPYQRLARRLGVEARVVFLGQRADAPRLLAAADALVLPTIYDPCSNACLEALYVGAPVVTTLANGAAELIDQGVNGVLLKEPADPEALAEACRQALALARPFPQRVSTQSQWLDRVETLLLETVRGGAS